MSTGYNYIERPIAPDSYEFYVQTPQGHRVVRVFLGPNPSIMAFNESEKARSPATLTLQEIHELLNRATELSDESKQPQ